MLGGLPSTPQGPRRPDGGGRPAQAAGDQAHLARARGASGRTSSAGTTYIEPASPAQVRWAAAGSEPAVVYRAS